MKKFMISAALIALATPAIAQQSTSVAQPAPTDAGTPSTTAPSTMAAPAEAAAPAAAAPTDPAAILESEFPSFDADKSGELSKAEFSAWMTALKDRSPTPETQKLTPAMQTKWLTQSFSQADTDKSKSVNLAELAKFLTAKS
jgi:hypothetical protein